ncbi:MXAN_5453 family MXYO-CTERM-anchored protein [Pyxidicoccus sp. 3LFB2]
MLTSALPAWAELPDYTPQLQARTNLRGNDSGAYNLEPGNLLPGSLQVPLTLDRQLAFRLSITPEGRQALWWGGDGMGSRIYQLPELGEDARAGDPGLNSQGDIAFAVTGASPTSANGIYVFNVSTPGQVRIIRQPVGASDWSSLWLNEAGQLGFRATFPVTGRAYALLSPQDGGGYALTYLEQEKGFDPDNRYQFLYSPTLNDRGQLAGVGDTATAGSEYFQELRIYEPDGVNSQVVVRSRGLDGSSPVYRFASVQPALNNRGQVAFLGTARIGNQNLTTLWLWTGSELRVLAQNGQGGIRDLEIFPPDINDSGLVVFRAFDSTGLRAVWVSDGQDLKRVVTEHDILPSDLGPARVDQETTSNPVFAGGPQINARGDVTFVAGLAPPDNNQEEWGTAIYVAQSSFSSPGDAGTDGGPGDEDSGTDAGPWDPDAGWDAGPWDPDAGWDAGPWDPDAGWDAGPWDPDAGWDAGPWNPDAGVDGGPGDADAGVDAGPWDPDAGVDGGPGESDSGVDGGPGDADAGVDGGPGESDAGLDAGPVETDAGPGEQQDSGVDAGSNEQPDAGSNQQPDAGQTPDAGTGQQPGEDTSGCGCQSTPTSAALSWMLLGLARFLSVRRRDGSRRG